MQIITTGINKPPFITIYGQPGVGKSRFAASMPRPVFVRSEDRHDHLGVQATEVLKDFSSLVEALDYFLTEKHDFKTVILDTADSFERAIQAEVCKRSGTGVTDILHPKVFPYYQGMTKSALLWEREILTRMSALNEERKIMPVILSHLQTATLEHPQYGSYLKFFPGVDKRLAAKIFKISDIVGFMDWQLNSKTSETETTRLTSTGQRILRLAPRPAWETKESYNLPELLEIPENDPGWPVLAHAIQAGTKVTGNLKKAVAAKVKKVTDPLTVLASSVNNANELQE